MRFFRATKHDVLCVLGSPGSGKTALLALLTEKSISSRIVTLAIKADMLPTHAPFDEWGTRELGIGITALDAVMVAASQSKVLVVVDQLDALASTVDMTSDRLNLVIDFVQRCAELPGVSVVCSCRSFEFERDPCFSVLDAEVIELSLPSWDDVAGQLGKHGITDASTWPKSFREILRTPQHLRLYLDRFEATGRTDTFSSYHLMVDELWDRTVTTEAERELLYDLTEFLVGKEQLWAPLVSFENQRKLIDSLDATDTLLTRLAENSGVFVAMDISDLVEHLTVLVSYRRSLVLSVCQAILASGCREIDLFEAGPHLVNIAMTLRAI